MLRSLVFLSLLVSITACGVRDSDLGETPGTAAGAFGPIPPEPDWDGNIPDEVSGLYEFAPNYLYISPGGYMTRLFENDGGDNCYDQREVEALTFDGGVSYSSAEVDESGAQTSETHDYEITFGIGGVMNLTEILMGGSLTSFFTPVEELLISDVPVCRN